MLVLSRKPEQSVIMTVNGTDVSIKVLVVEISGSQVRLGFEAPQSVAIARDDCVKKPAA